MACKRFQVELSHHCAHVSYVISHATSEDGSRYFMVGLYALSIEDVVFFVPMWSEPSVTFFLN